LRLALRPHPFLPDPISPCRLSPHPISHALFSPAPTPTNPSTLSLHDALPISKAGIKPIVGVEAYVTPGTSRHDRTRLVPGVTYRSEEHTSELQSRFDLVCRLLLEKKNNEALHTP